jgi:hypothetical protein
MKKVPRRKPLNRYLDGLRAMVGHYRPSTMRQAGNGKKTP